VDPSQVISITLSIMASPETIVEPTLDIQADPQTLNPENEGLILGERKKHFEGKISSPLDKGVSR
jgi:hypothetical protein